MKTKLLIPIAFIAVLAILAGCDKEPTACFTFTSESIDNEDDPLIGEDIEFENCSENATSYEWDFDDGEESTKESPKHAFDAPGTYEVTLTATGDGGSKSTSQEITVKGSLTGTWEGFMDNEYPIIIEIEQNGTDLEGYWEFSDGSGHSTLASGSEIDGQDVTLKFTEPSYNMVFTYTGEVNDDFDEMDGTYSMLYGGDTFAGVWSVSKSSKKSAGDGMQGKGLDSFLKKIQ